MEQSYLHLGVVAIEKGPFWLLSTTDDNFTYLRIEDMEDIERNTRCSFKIRTKRNLNGDSINRKFIWISVLKAKMVILVWFGFMAYQP